MKILSKSLFALALVQTPLVAGDWTQFRGSDSSGVSTEKNLPTKWSKTKNIRWKAALPGRGLSNPVIAKGRVYVTASSGYRESRLHVLCFEEATGKQLWERQFTSTGNTACHPKTNMAAPTPTTDGNAVYAQFATGDVVALDRDGNLLWYRSLVSDYPTITNQVGMASSPLLVDGVLVVPMENVGESFLAGLDTKTGKNLWKVSRKRATNWVSPIVKKIGGKSYILFHNGDSVDAYDVKTGDQNWTYPTERGSNVSSSVAAGDVIFVPGSPLVALKPTKAGQTPEVLWKSPRMSLGYTSPVYHDGRLYGLLRNIGLNCLDAKTGKRVWQQRIKGNYSASPIIADGKIYAVDEKGVTTVVALGDEPKVLATNELDDTILATPAVANGAIYLRSDKFLYCIGKKAE